jgi:glycosyltransferase involved in cell wall biosynthesis
MIVGVDARAAAEVPAGRGRYVRELLTALDALDDDGTRYRLFARERWGALSTRFGWSRIGARDPLWHLVAAVRASRSCDVMLSTNSYLTAWFTSVPTAVVVYDLVPFIEGTHAQARAARIERATIRRAMMRGAAFICISEATKRDLTERFPHAQDRAHVIPLAAHARFAASVEPARLDKPYVLAAGTLEPRKNLVRLIEAWVALPDEVRDTHVLALVGPPGWEIDATLAAARARADEVRLLGFVDDDELAALYAGAAAFAYPSLYEGFGLPVLEAMSAGAPVVTSSVSSLPEVAGGAALLVDPNDVRALRDALHSLLSDPREAARLSRAGRLRAAEFTWERTALETRALLHAISRAPGD